MSLKEMWKGWEDEEQEDISSYCMTLRKQDTEN
jgi:hypothetical protein